ncbi:hypothetical protein DL769_000500 [Monosporascus sp. CRB-8-3]|nr:hypothetical protein DL769_000500 [Monosporascus sp. CRB-8-3]
MSGSSSQGQSQQAVGGPLHTPTQSFSGNAQAPATRVPGPLWPTSIWNDKKFQEDYEHMKARLSDPKSNIIKNYDDPLLPREQPPEAYYPKGVTRELEAHLHDVIRKVKGPA